MRKTSRPGNESCGTPSVFPWIPILAAVCGSACLFLIELFAGKVLLPRFGGSPSTWVSCLAFFQLALVAAYVWSDWLIRTARPQRQVLAVAALFVAAAIVTLLAARSDAAAVLEAALPRPLAVFAALALGVGPAFFAVATLAPLLGHWRTLWRERNDAADPSPHDAYGLYAAGNAGSFAALVAYPLVVEPVAGLEQQVEMLAMLFCSVGGLALATGWHTACSGTEAQTDAGPDAGNDAGTAPLPVGWPAWLRWVALAAIPSSWLASITTHATVEIAPIPLLWILFLGIYLASFVIVFARWGRDLRRFEPVALVAAVGGAAWLLGCNVEEPKWLVLSAHAVIFLVVCVGLHGMLVDQRPPPRQLPRFYLAMAVGGACGGLFNALLAPLVFDAHHEFPLAIAAVAGIIPAVFPKWPGGTRWIAAAAAASIVALANGAAPLLPPSRIFWMAAIAAAVAVAIVFFRGGLRGAVLATLLFATFVIAERGRDVILRSRTFFGVLRVCEDENGPSRNLVHGSISHGAQLVSADPDRRAIPLSYYHHTGPLGSVFSALEGRGGVRRVGIAGLGIGTIAAYARAGQEFAFFEIDPEVERIARNPDWFTFLADCRGDARVVVDDARLALEREPDGCFDLLVIDAFTGDSVPTHLLTREALALYGRKITPEGVVAIHISNQYLDFVPVVEALAADGGWMALDGHDLDVPSDFARLGSHWMALSRSLQSIQAIYVSPTSDRWQWRPAADGPPRRPWTDDSTRVVEALR